MKFTLFLWISTQKVHGFVYPDKWYDLSYHLFSTFYFLFTYYPIEQECVTKQYRISTLKKNHFKIFRVNVAVFKSRILHHSNNLQAVSSCTTLPSGNYCPFPWYITLYSYSYHNPNSFFVPLKLHLAVTCWFLGNHLVLSTLIVLFLYAY